MTGGLPRLYVVGGKARWNAQARQEWRRHEKGLVLEVDPESGEIVQRVAYRSPPEVLPDQDEPAVLFKAATVEGDRLYACTTTEVLVYRLPDFQVERYLSLPSFNDVHHVRPTARGTLLVASTGLDLICEIDEADRVVAEWSAVEDAVWSRFDPATDYRRVASTKPHAAHPNYVFEAQGEIWATRFEQRDALCLTDPSRRIAIDVEKPHDGIVVGETVYFTTVDGQVAVADLGGDRVDRILDLNDLQDTDYALGWCRGLAPLDGDRVVVGFSRLRPTLLRQNVRWLKHRLGLSEHPGNLPCRIACIDLAAEEWLWEIDLESAGLSSIFSIHALPSAEEA